MAATRARLKRIEAATRKATAPAADDEASARNAHAAEVERFRREFAETAPEVFALIEKHVAPDQRLSLMCAMVEFDEESADAMLQWAARPFAPWATMPKGYQFAWKLIETFYRPAETLKLGDACERCGLRVPVYTFGPVCGDVPAFPNCPECGGATNTAANGQTGPKVDPP